MKVKSIEYLRENLIQISSKNASNKAEPSLKYRPDPIHIGSENT